MVSSYVPPLPCREHMLRDLPAVLQGVEQLAFIVDECGIMSEAVLQRLPAGGGSVRLPPDQALAVFAYAFDLGLNSQTEDGSDNLYAVLNRVLRDRNPGKLHLLKPYLCFLMRGLAALPEFAGVVFRGIPSEALPVVRDRYLVGSDIHWSSFTSTATSLSAKVRQFAGGPGGIVFRITVCSGRVLGAYTPFPEEEEVVLSPNTRLFVSSALSLAADGYWYLDLVERRGDSVVF